MLMKPLVAKTIKEAVKDLIDDTSILSMHSNFKEVKDVAASEPEPLDLNAKAYDPKDHDYEPDYSFDPEASRRSDDDDEESSQLPPEKRRLDFSAQKFSDEDFLGPRAKRPKYRLPPGLGGLGFISD